MYRLGNPRSTPQKPPVASSRKSPSSLYFASGCAARSISHRGAQRPGEKWRLATEDGLALLEGGVLTKGALGVSCLWLFHHTYLTYSHTEVSVSVVFSRSMANDGTKPYFATLISLPVVVYRGLFKAKYCNHSLYDLRREIPPRICISRRTRSWNELHIGRPGQIGELEGEM